MANYSISKVGVFDITLSEDPFKRELLEDEYYKNIQLLDYNNLLLQFQTSFRINDKTIFNNELKIKAYDSLVILNEFYNVFVENQYKISKKYLSLLDEKEVSSLSKRDQVRQEGSKIFFNFLYEKFLDSEFNRRIGSDSINHQQENPTDVFSSKEIEFLKSFNEIKNPLKELEESTLRYPKPYTYIFNRFFNYTLDLVTLYFNQTEEFIIKK